jgi:hypothetical protein
MNRIRFYEISGTGIGTLTVINKLKKPHLTNVPLFNYSRTGTGIHFCLCQIFMSCVLSLFDTHRFKLAGPGDV